MIASYQQDPGATLDYTMDWSKYLETGDTITAHSYTVGAGVTKVTDSHTDSTTTVWLTAGVLNATCNIVCQITTVGGRVDERTFVVAIANR